MLRHTYAVERHLNGGGVSYRDCFKGTDLRRTEIVCMAGTTQSLCGSALTGYAVYFYEQAGLSSVNAVTVSIGVCGAGIVGGFLSWIWLRIVGRRTIYLCGLILLTFIYDTTIGPVCYVLVAETPSSHLRIKTVVLARIAYSLSSLVVNVVTTRMLNLAAWHWSGRSGFLFAGTTACCLAWAYFRLPESKGLTYFELDVLFSRKAPARKFRQFRMRLEDAGYFSLARTDHPANIWDPR